MSDLRNVSKAFMADFIELYKSYPCLWKTKSSDYKERNKKDAAYTVLLKKLQEIEPNATKNTVKAKINGIRSCFRREMKKIEDSKRSGAAADEIYKTHLWYYDLLLFTKDQEMPHRSVSNIVENRKVESGSEQETDDGDEKTQEIKYRTQEIEHAEGDLESQMSPPARCLLRSSTPGTNKSSKRKRKNKVDEQTDEVLAIVGIRLRNNVTDNDDAYNIFGKHVAAKLRALPKQTKLYTEKLINDLLFEAEIGHIDKNTKIVTYGSQ